VLSSALVARNSFGAGLDADAVAAAAVLTRSAVAPPEEEEFSARAWAADDPLKLVEAEAWEAELPPPTWVVVCLVCASTARFVLRHDALCHAPAAPCADPRPPPPPLPPPRPAGLRSCRRRTPAGAPSSRTPPSPAASWPPPWPRSPASTSSRPSSWRSSPPRGCPRCATCSSATRAATPSPPRGRCPTGTRPRARSRRCVWWWN
jgi:hypothetical protein